MIIINLGDVYRLKSHYIHLCYKITGDYKIKKLIENDHFLMTYLGNMQDVNMSTYNNLFILDKESKDICLFFTKHGLICTDYYNTCNWVEKYFERILL